MPDIEDRTVGIPRYVLANQALANPRNEDTFWQVLRICEISALPYHNSINTRDTCHQTLSVIR